MRHCFLNTVFLFLIFFFLGGGLLARSRDEIESDSIEFGVRAGLGYKARQEFDNQLSKYSTVQSSNTYQKSEISTFDSMWNSEIFFRRRWSPDFKVGFVVGYNQYEPIFLKEYRSDGYYTKLRYNINTVYFLITYHHEWIFRRFFLEGGFGIGMNNTVWYASGSTVSQKEFIPESGKMWGEGLMYKLEGSINKKVTDEVILQLGLAINYVTLPEFNGSINGESGGYYIRNDGSVSPLTNSQYADSIYFERILYRKMDFAVASAVIYFSGMYRISI